jgi:copper chaperone
MTLLSPPSTTYRVAGMTCEHCRIAVTAEVGAIAGVTAVHVDLDAELVHVQGDGLDPVVVVAAIDEAGYEGVAA